MRHIFVQTDNFGYSNAFKCELCVGQYNYPSHLHQYTELIYVYEGELELTVNDAPELMHEGEFAIIMPFQVHKLNAPKHSRVWISVFSDVFISEFVKKRELIYGEKCVFTPNDVTRDYVLSKLTELGNIDDEDDMKDISMRQIKAGLFAIFEEYFSNVPVKEKFEENDMFSKLILYIHTNSGENVTLASAATQLGYSANYISHYFKTVMHMNFCSFLNCIRVEKAKTLLLSTHDQSADIASQCGFSCERTFHRAFRKVTGMTPSQYRLQGHTH